MIDIITDVISKAAAIYDLAKQLGDQKFLQRIADLQKDLIDLQMEHNGLRIKNMELQQKAENMENVIKGELKFNKITYFHKDTGEAFCAACLDAEHVLMHLTPTTGTANAVTYKCPRCKTTYRLH
jgi:hypothetical protein